MDMIVETVATTNMFELLRVVWMEVAMASFAATIYFTFSGWLGSPTHKKVKSLSASPRWGSTQNSPRNQETNTFQQATKALRQGKIKTAIALIQQLPEAAAGCVPVSIAPRLLMAAAKSQNLEEAMGEMSVFVGKFQGQSFDAVVAEAVKNKDLPACRQLRSMCHVLSIPQSQQAFDTFAKLQGADATFLRSLTEDAPAPLTMPFAKAVLEACARLKDTDLAAEVFEKIAEADAPALRDVVEKAAAAASAAADASSAKDAVTSSSKAKEIRTCGKNGDLEQAIKIFVEHREQSLNALMYNSIMDACVECGDLEKALEYYNLSTSSGHADIVTQNTAMKTYVAQGKTDVAEKLFRELSEKGFTPTLASYHILLNHRAPAGDRLGAWKLVDEMQAAGVQPNATTCAILLKGKPTAADIDRILTLSDSLEAMDEVFFHSLAEACVHTGQLRILTKYHAKLASQSSSPALTAPTYGSMIKAFGQAHDIKTVWDLWGEMVKHSIQPTAITLGCMVEALVANNRTAPAWELVQRMRKEESTRALVNTVIYSTILKGFANAQETDKVMSLYEEMKANDIQPNNITYNTILNSFAQGGEMDRVPALLEDMKKAVPPAEPDLVTFSTLVKGYCNRGQLDRALQVVEDMRSDGKWTPDEVMYNSLLDGCAKEQRPNEAMKLLDDMRKAGVAPSNYTLSMLVKLLGRCKRLNQAFSLIAELSQEYGLKVNIQVYTCLIQACFNGRQAAKAIALHDQIIAEGLIPDQMTYSVLVRGSLKAGLVEKAVYLTRCAYGLGIAKFKGPLPGIKDIDDVVWALGGSQSVAAKKLLDEIAEAQAAAPRRQAKGSGKGRGCTPPWRRS